MGLHNDTANDYQLFNTGSQTIADPGSGGTFSLRGIDRGIATIASGTRKLPDNVPLGVKFLVYATGSVTITNAAGNVTVATLGSGDVCEFIAKTSSSWVAKILTTGASREGTITVPLMSITGEDGTVLAKQASTTSGWTQLSNKNIVLNIPVNATNEAFSFSVTSPEDIDTSKPVYVDLFASKAADDDTLTLDCELYAFGDGGSGVGADIITTSAQTIYEDMSAALTFTGTIDVNGDGFGGVITLGGTNDGDAVYIHGVRIRYTKLY